MKLCITICNLKAIKNKYKPTNVKVKIIIYFTITSMFNVYHCILTNVAKCIYFFIKRRTRLSKDNNSNNVISYNLHNPINKNIFVLFSTSFRSIPKKQETTKIEQCLYFVYMAANVTK